MEHVVKNFGQEFKCDKRGGHEKNHWYVPCRVDATEPVRKLSQQI